MTDPVLHDGAGSPSATITGPDGSLDLRVHRDTGVPSVHLATPGLPQYGTCDPIDTPLGVNLGASVIGVPDADLHAVVERAAPIVANAQHALDHATAQRGTQQPSAPMSFADVKAIASGTPDAGADSRAMRARASFEAGGSAVAAALARLEAKNTTTNHRDDRPHYSRGGPSIR